MEPKELAEQELSVPVKPPAPSLVIVDFAGEDVYNGDLHSMQLAGQMVGHGCRVDCGPKIWLTLAIDMWLIWLMRAIDFGGPNRQ
ncbi:hypothetical protein GB937_007621 [Aspergillus fischeri]|nr:hypothetical protein GB937_007621 [Aspergillus fischeri]